MDKIQKTNQQYYDKNAESWAERKQNSFYHEKAFIKYAELLSKGRSVIDIGCAYGIHVPLFFGIGRH